MYIYNYIYTYYWSPFFSKHVCLESSNESGHRVTLQLMGLVEPWCHSWNSAGGIRPPITNLSFFLVNILGCKPLLQDDSDLEELSSGGILVAIGVLGGASQWYIWWFYRVRVCVILHQLHAATLPSSSYGACPGAVGQLQLWKQPSATTFILFAWTYKNWEIFEHV